MPPMPLNKHDAGRLLKQRREERGLTQEQVVENTTVPNAGYLSNIESGNINPARTKHFPSLAVFLSLSEEDIRSINPSAVFEAPPPRRLTDAERRGWVLPEDDDEPEIPETLLIAAQKYGHGDNAPFAERRWLRELSELDFREEPETPEDWLAIYSRLSKLIDPKDN